jgi:hypothetical protein
VTLGQVTQPDLPFVYQQPPYSTPLTTSGVPHELHVVPLGHCSELPTLQYLKQPPPVEQ